MRVSAILSLLVLAGVQATELSSHLQSLQNENVLAFLSILKFYNASNLPLFVFGKDYQLAKQNPYLISNYHPEISSVIEYGSFLDHYNKLVMSEEELREFLKGVLEVIWSGEKKIGGVIDFATGDLVTFPDGINPKVATIVKERAEIFKRLAQDSVNGNHVKDVLKSVKMFYKNFGGTSSMKNIIRHILNYLNGNLHQITARNLWKFVATLPQNPQVDYHKLFTDVYSMTRILERTMGIKLRSLNKANEIMEDVEIVGQLVEASSENVEKFLEFNYRFLGSDKRLEILEKFLHFMDDNILEASGELERKVVQSIDELGEIMDLGQESATTEIETTTTKELVETTTSEKEFIADEGTTVTPAEHVESTTIGTEGSISTELVETTTSENEFIVDEETTVVPAELVETTTIETEGSTSAELVETTTYWLPDIQVQPALDSSVEKLLEETSKNAHIFTDDWIVNTMEKFPMDQLKKFPSMFYILKEICDPDWTWSTRDLAMITTDGWIDHEAVKSLLAGKSWDSLHKDTALASSLFSEFFALSPENQQTLFEHLNTPVLKHAELFYQTAQKDTKQLDLLTDIIAPPAYCSQSNADAVLEILKISKEFGNNDSESFIRLSYSLSKTECSKAYENVGVDKILDLLYSEFGIESCKHHNSH